MWRFLKTLNIEFPYDPTVLLLCISPDQIYICSPMFITALFTVVKTRKPPKSLLTDEWLKKMWYIYTTEYYAAIKKSGIMPFAATWMDLESVILREISQKETNIWYHLHVESEIWDKNRFTDIENRRVVAKGRRDEGEKDWVFEVSRHTLLHIRWIKTRSYCIAQRPVFSVFSG